MGVVLRIKEKDSAKTLEKKINSFQKLQTGFPAHKSIGKIKFPENIIEVQRKLRDEWE